MSIHDAERFLARLDPNLALLVDRAGPCDIGGRRARPHFESLARAITYQQLAGRAAQSIWTRVRALVDGPFTADAVVALDHDTLRSAGLSGSKARAIADLADKVVGGQVRLASIGRRTDDEVVAELSQVWGVGRWTAEMFLMFQLGRLDVWPTGDLGVRNGYAVLFGLPRAPTPDELEALGERFRPWRSVAAWYCWRAIDVTVPDG